MASFAAQPLTQFVFVIALVAVNQVLFNAYVLRVHGGSASFLSKWLGPGWCALAIHEPLVRYVAAHVGDGVWLSPTVLRVQAFLELPFTLYAYLAVARLLDRAVYRSLVRAPWLLFASVSFTVTFCIVERVVANPWTTDDIVMRGIAMMVVPVYVAWMGRVDARASARRSPLDGPPRGVLGVVTFLVGAAAMAVAVLVVYDVFLLYNLGHIGRYAPLLAIALVVTAVASFVAPRIDHAVASLFGRSKPSRSPAIDAVGSALGVFTTLFFVPSLSLRYWGEHPTAQVSGALLILVSAASGVVATLFRSKMGLFGLFRFVVSAAAALGAGAFSAVGATGWVARTVDWRSVPELLLGVFAVVFLGATTVTFRAFELALGVSWPPHEAKAPVDQA